MPVEGSDAPDGKTQTIKEAHAALSSELLHLPGITMIGIGECGGAPCLRVYVVALADEIRQRVPDSQGGWPVELCESGPIRALPATPES